MKNILRGFSILALTAFSCMAANFSFIGTFTQDSDVEYFTMTLVNPTPGVALRTWSYLGGTNGNGDVIPNGGFEPLISIWLSDGTAMNPGPAGPCTGNTGNPLTTLGVDPVTGACSDVYYPTALAFPGGIWAAGTYTIGLSVYVNFPLGVLSDGYLLDSTPGNTSCQTSQGTPAPLPLDTPFCDEWLPGTARTGHWALDIRNVDTAADLSAPGVPEPGTIVTFVSGAMLLVARKLRAHRLTSRCE